MLKFDKKYRIPSGESMRIKCNQCGKEFLVNKSKVDFNWEPIETIYDGEMGEEHKFESQDSVVCPKCLRYINIIFHIWEYPSGSFNYAEVKCTDESGVIMTQMDISDEINFDHSDLGHCEKCGEYKRLDLETGLCQDCLQEKWMESLSDR